LTSVRASSRPRAERSSFVTCANMVVDGGMTRKMIYAE